MSKIVGYFLDGGDCMCQGCVGEHLDEVEDAHTVFATDVEAGESYCDFCGEPLMGTEG